MRWGAVLRVLVLQAAWAAAGGQVRYSVPEEAKAGTVLGRLAQDLGLEAGEAEARRLRLVAQGRRASVEVSGASGALVLSSRLDREELCGKSAPCALRLEVLVERPLRVFHVELEVTDINDNAPVFPAARKNLSLSENSPPGFRIPLEGASDADIGANAQLTYTLSPSEHFSLELQNSNARNIEPELVLTKPLDRETIPVHRLVLTASDGGRPSLTGTMELLISVLDANDNAPQFNQSVYKVQLPESAAVGTLVTRVNATDADEGINSQVIYTVTNFLPPSGRDVISVNPNTGEIHLTGALDFEDANIFNFRIEARDQGTPPLSGHCKVELEVLDVNDNAPEVWVTSLSVPVPEDASLGTVVALLSVSDRDSGANGRVRCWVWPASPFGLEATFAGSYSLVLREALDRERVSEYEVEVRAEDGGAPSLRASRGLVLSSRLDREELCGKSAPCALRLEVLVERPLRVFHVELEVTDINDNAPVFRVDEEALSIAELSMPGSRFPLEGASDADIGANAQLTYTLSPSEYFSLDHQGNNDQSASLGLILTKALDRETIPVHRLVLTASDGGRPSLTGTMELVISVLDANDNPPQFNQSVYKVKVLEGSELGTLLVTLSATDPDEGINSDIVYSFSRRVSTKVEEMFTIDENKGEIRLQGKLDYEEINRYEIPVEARDKGSPPLSGHCKVVLEVLDVNDNAPEVMVTSLSVPVPEDASLGTVVALLSVSDRDSGANGRVRCWVWPASPFGLEATFAGSYSLVLREALDRERVSEYEVEVRAEDGGAPSLRASRGIAELSVPGSRFPLEGASDADIGANAQLTYTLSPSEHFSLDLQKTEEDDESLFLVLRKPLDRETIPVHRLVLTASDGGRPSLTGTMELLISVLDANDNPPQFNQSVYKVQLPESTEHGTLVIKLNATDLDEGSNRNVLYSLDTLFPQDGKEVFEIDRRTGEIRLRNDLDFEDVSLYRLQVDATDQGTPPLSGHCKVVLEVLDVNDNAPEVMVTSLSVPVPEDASLGTVVALLSVSDRDSGANGRVRCWVWPASPFGLEATFAGSYSLVLREALDRERVSEYEVEVRAEDGGAPSLRASRGLRVPVSDVNDNAPAFAQAVYTVLARENNARHSRSLCVADGAGKSDLMVFSPNFPPPPPPGPAAENGSAGKGPSLSPLASSVGSLTEGSRISVSALNKRYQFRLELSVAVSPGCSDCRTLFWRALLIQAMSPGTALAAEAGLAAGSAAERFCGRLREREERRGGDCSARSAVVAGGCFAASKRDFTGREMLPRSCQALPVLGAEPLLPHERDRVPVPAVAGVLPGSFRQARLSLTGGQQTDLLC
ncbi:protocadherin alpha-10-like [Cyanistes caeruleus]|uniref:protocadherin alpha-10-like n=1 Tax=Cyanistes caeruleus TaxID=156563 RepID=UPI000CDB1EFF|nr:protocadherin alpha-10-like [Cyanistes caeruleus]